MINWQVLCYNWRRYSAFSHAYQLRVKRYFIIKMKQRKYLSENTK